MDYERFKRDVFQYPLRVEVGCNFTVVCVLDADTRVSVPSTGRSGLQRVFVCQCGVDGGVSVPSTGRSGLQLLRALESYHLKPEFQYPLRVEVGCNMHDDYVSALALAVSVPSTGRSGLQPARCALATSCSKVSVPSTGRSGLQLDVANAIRAFA